MSKDATVPINPNTLIALRVLTDALGKVKDPFRDKHLDPGAMEYRGAMADYLEDLLWGRLIVLPYKGLGLPPIHDIITLCDDCDVNLKCELLLSPVEFHEYRRTTTMGMHNTYIRLYPGGEHVLTDRESASLWKRLEEEQSLETTLEDADPLPEALVRARFEVITRDFDLDIKRNPHKNKGASSTADFKDSMPVRLDFLSNPKGFHEAAKIFVQNYLRNFAEGKINWGEHAENVLDWAEQKKWMMKLLREKHHRFKKPFWLSKEDFPDDALRDGLKPIETLFALAEQGDAIVGEKKYTGNPPVLSLEVDWNWRKQKPDYKVYPLSSREIDEVLSVEVEAPIVNIPSSKEARSPDTLIALLTLREFFAWMNKECDLSTEDGSITAQRTLERIKSSYLDDLLWKRASFDEKKSDDLPPIYDLLMLCFTAQVDHMRMTLRISDQEAVEYDKATSLYMMKNLQQMQPDGSSVLVNQKFIELWNKLMAEGSLDTMFGEAGFLSTYLIQAWREAILRDEKLELEESQNLGLSLSSTRDFFHLSPVRPDWISAGVNLENWIANVFKGYLKNFMEDPKQINWDMHVLDWSQQREITLKILAHKQSLYPEGSWYSAQNFRLEDAAAEEGYRPLETLLALAEIGEITIRDFRENKSHQIEPFIVMQNKKKIVSPAEAAIPTEPKGKIAYVLTRNISGHILINGRVFAKPQPGTVQDRFAEFILKPQHARPLDLSKEELMKIRATDKKEIPKVITDLGFKKAVREMFFPAISKNKVTFVNPVYEKDLVERGLPRLQDYD